jgi:hypothetical protein
VQVVERRTVEHGHGTAIEIDIVRPRHARSTSFSRGVG